MSEDLRAWARQMAAELPPFTPEEAAEIGRIAARLDARRRATADQHTPETKAAA